MRYKQLLPSGKLSRDVDRDGLVENLGGEQTWQALFDTNSPVEAEQRAKARGYECRWNDVAAKGEPAAAAGGKGPLTLLSAKRPAFRHGAFWNQASNVFSFVYGVVKKKS